jgi:hypothetical protein
MPILTADDGLVAKTPEEQQTLQAAGYQQCYGTRSNLGNRPCDFHVSPEAQAHITDKGGYFTCPRCLMSHDLLHDLPWHGATREESEQAIEQDQENSGWKAGGGTRIGIGMREQAQLGEDLVTNLKELPGYGPITWVHPGGAISPSPLDMATKEWGIEVKTLGYDATHHRFVPGRPKEKEDKNAMAAAKGYRGVLGILVLLNYRTSKADIYAQEFPIEQGVSAFRSGSPGSQHLVAEVPFNNPFMDPAHPAPHGPNTQVQNEPIPF